MDHFEVEVGKGVEVDVRGDESVVRDEDGEHSGVHEEFCGALPDQVVLVIGGLRVVMTKAQSDFVRFYFENT